MSPTGGPDAPLRLTPPQTRATDGWTKMWRQIVRDGPQATRRARSYSQAARRKRGSR